jgi:predicted transcriptional regulator
MTRKGSDKLHPTPERIIELITENPEINRTELVKTLGIASGTLAYHLKNLRDILGTKRNGHTTSFYLKEDKTSLDNQIIATLDPITPKSRRDIAKEMNIGISELNVYLNPLLEGDQVLKIQEGHLELYLRSTESVD